MMEEARALMYRHHNPLHTKNRAEFWYLVLVPVFGGVPVIISTRPLTFDEAKEAGMRINGTRDKIGFAFKVDMQPVSTCQDREVCKGCGKMFYWEMEHGELEPPNGYCSCH